MKNIIEQKKQVQWQHLKELLVRNFFARYTHIEGSGKKELDIKEDEAKIQNQI